MKLNLLPSEASRANLTPIAIIAAAALALGSIVLAIAMIAFSKTQVEQQKNRATQLEPAYQRAVAISKEAETIMAESTDIDRNLKLANAMLAHNGQYAILFDEVLTYVPSWFRVSSMTASAQGPELSTVTMTGVLDTAQQYTDMMLALARIPQSASFARSGFVHTRPFIPGLTEFDQDGNPIRPGEDPLPDDPWERFQAQVQRAQADTQLGYQNLSGFGSGTDGARGPLEDYSQVTFTIVMRRNLQAPDPQATLAAGGAAPEGAAPATGTPAGNVPASTGGRSNFQVNRPGGAAGAPPSANAATGAGN